MSLPLTVWLVGGAILAFAIFVAGYLCGRAAGIRVADHAHANAWREHTD